MAVSVQKREVAPDIFDTPYAIVINHCPECGKNSMAGKRGEMIGVGDADFERAACDGAVFTADEHGMPVRMFQNSQCLPNFPLGF